jgi:hypothetical protein
VAFAADLKKLWVIVAIGKRAVDGVIRHPSYLGLLSTRLGGVWPFVQGSACCSRRSFYRRFSRASLLTGHTDGLPLKMSEMMNRIRKRTNNTWAIHAEVPAIPVNPKIAAIMATTKKTNA